MRRRVTRSHREADRSGETPRGVSVERAETARSLGSGMPRLVKSAELFNSILRLKKKEAKILIHCIKLYCREGNGNPLQCSCLENPVDRGACWAAVHRVAQSRTRLKRLSSSSKLYWGRGSGIQTPHLWQCQEGPFNPRLPQLLKSHCRHLLA